MNKLKILSSTLLALLLFASCAKQQQPQSGDTTNTAAAVKSGQGVAIVRAVNAPSKTVTLSHDTIPGIMDAMTMEYPIADTTMLRGIAVGDSVRFTLQDDGQGDYLVTQITKE